MSVTAPNALYSRDMLALAVELAQYPYDQAAPLTGEARSRACGSVLSLSGHPAGEGGGLEKIGLRASTCAVGQASAAIFLRGAYGKNQAQLEDVRGQLERWLADEGEAPAWPDLEILAPALAFPARHGAILLPWKAALSALSSPAIAR